MKVSFQLTAGQSLIALAVKAKIAIDVMAEPDLYLDGNLSAVSDNGYGVRQQTMTLSSDSRTITYEGARSTLRAGMADCLGVLKRISGGDLSTLRVAEYVTTDPTLKWWENKADTVTTLTTGELVRHCKAENCKFSGHSSKLGYAAWLELNRRSDDKLSNLLKEGDLTKASAGWTIDEIRLQRSINACIL